MTKSYRLAGTLLLVMSVIGGPVMAQQADAVSGGNETVRIIQNGSTKTVTPADLVRSAGVSVPVTAKRELRVVNGVGARIPNQASGSNNRAISFVTYRAAAPIARPRILHQNWYVPNNGAYAETDGSAAMTASDWLEFPLGEKLTPCAGVTIAPGAEGLDDCGSIAIPRGASFRVWSLRVGPLAIYSGFPASPTLPFGHQIKFGASEAQTPVPTGPGQTIASPLGSNGYFPAVVDDSSYRAVGLLGDSHETGIPGDTPTLFNQLGPFERFYGELVPLFNISTSGQATSHVVAAGNFTKRRRLMAYVSDIEVGVGGNDISANRSAPEIIADLKTLSALMPANKRLFTATELPKTTSTDSFATVSGQSVTANEPARLALNDFKRSGFFDYYLDFERLVGVLNSTGIVWPAGGTTDGTHGSDVSNTRVNAVPVGRLP